MGVGILLLEVIFRFLFLCSDAVPRVVDAADGVSDQRGRQVKVTGDLYRMLKEGQSLFARISFPLFLRSLYLQLLA